MYGRTFLKKAPSRKNGRSNNGLRSFQNSRGQEGGVYSHGQIKLSNLSSKIQLLTDQNSTPATFSFVAFHEIRNLLTSPHYFISCCLIYLL